MSNVIRILKYHALQVQKLIAEGVLEKEGGRQGALHLYTVNRASIIKHEL